MTSGSDHPAKSSPGEGTVPGPGELPIPRVEVGFTGSGLTGRVVLTEVGPISRHVIELGPQAARQIADSMREAARKVDGGLILPNGAGPL